MTRIVDDLVLALILAAVSLGSCISCDARPAEAQSRSRSADVSAIAQCLVAEDEVGTDWAAILGVLDRRAHEAGMSVASMARAYCAVHRTARPSRRQAWIRALPHDYPSQRIREVYARAVELVRTWDGVTPCAADHWGAASGEDHARAVRAGWVRVECASRNAFWRLP